ncbi:MAG: hypothetical protein RMK57_16860, partial [Bryobacterales bacterium]|nr:hypothetical protein [Bryobacterales bacterium]
HTGNRDQCFASGLGGYTGSGAHATGIMRAMRGGRRGCRIARSAQFGTFRAFMLAGFSTRPGAVKAECDRAANRFFRCTRRESLIEVNSVKGQRPKSTKKSQARQRSEQNVEAAPRPAELQRLEQVSTVLGSVLSLMEPMVKSLPRLDLHYRWYQWVADRALRGAASAPLSAPESAEEWRLQEKTMGGITRRAVRLQAVEQGQTIDIGELSEEIDHFYAVFRELYDAARPLEIAQELLNRSIPEDGNSEPEGDPSPEMMARLALRRALNRSSLEKKHHRIRALFEAVQTRREEVRRAWEEQCRWHTPEGRKAILQEYCAKHSVTIDELAEQLHCDRKLIYNWRDGKTKGQGKKTRLLEIVLRNGTAPDEISALAEESGLKKALRERRISHRAW